MAILVLSLILGSVTVLSVVVKRISEKKLPYPVESAKLEEVNLPEYSANEILIKVKKSSLGKIKAEIGKSGIKTLDEFGGKFRIKKIEKTIKESKNSNTDHDLYSWYTLTWEGSGKKIKADFNNDKGSINSDDPEARQLEEMITLLRNDPDIENAEPNFTVFTTQSGCESQMTLSLAQSTITTGPGGTYTNVLSVTNNGSGTCGPVNISSTYPAGWTQQLERGSVTVNPGSVVNVNVTMTVSPNAAFQNYNHLLWLASYGAGGVAETVQVTVNLTNTPVTTPTSTIQPTTTATPSATSAPTSVPTSTQWPNDPYLWSSGSWGQAFGDLWGINKINPHESWRSYVGEGVVVASIDTGVDRNHTDLAENMWTNPDEIPQNGLDDDANGKIDDFYGWDFVSNDNDPMDDHGHGTHTAGTIAAVGNNAQGVVGVAWKSKIMAVKFLNSGGSGQMDWGANAIRYAADEGVKVLSNSWGCYCQSTLVDDAMKYAYTKGAVNVAAAGNANSDALDHSPASSDWVVTVAASDSNDSKAGFSNWGSKIDVSAPGVDTLSLKSAAGGMCTTTNTVGSNYCRVSGTSMATPHVSALAALLLSKNPTFTPGEVKQLLRNGAIDLGTPGRDINFGYGRIDVGKTLSQSEKPLNPVITSPKSRSSVFGTITITGGIQGTDFSSYKVEVGSGRNPSAWTEVALSTTQVTNGTLATLDTTKLTTGSNTVRLTAISTSGKEYVFQIFDLSVNNFVVNLTYPSDLVPKSVVNVEGSAYTSNGLTLSRYVLEWGEGTNPGTFSTSGITLEGNGTTPVVNGKLGTWDTSALNHKSTYTLRLTVYSTVQTMDQRTVSIMVDGELVPGWPKKVNTSGNLGYLWLGGAISDINNDGVDEAVAIEPGKLNVFKKDGSNIAGFPVPSDSGYPFNGLVNIQDLDGDGSKEIVVNGVESTNSNNERIYILRNDGSRFAGWMYPTLLTYPSNDLSPAIADIDKDGVFELLVFASNGYLHAYKPTGGEVTGFPKAIITPNSNFGGGLAISDMDKDGQVEIAAGRTESVTGHPSRFYLFDNSGNLLSGWPKTETYNGGPVYFENTASFGDVDGDGSLEVFVMGNLTAHYCGGCTGIIYGWKKDGSLLSGWPKTVGGTWSSPYQSPVLADIDADGKDEIAIAAGGLRVFDPEGLKYQEGGSANLSASALTASDIDGDGKVEFTGAVYESLKIIKEGGLSYWDRTLSRNGTFFHAPISVGDLDNNGKMEILASRSAWTTSSGTAGYFYLWEIPTNGGTAKYEWSLFNHDEKHSGRQSIIWPQATQTTVPTAFNTPVPTFTPTSIPGDSIPPVVNITSPRNGATLSRNKNVQIIAGATDNAGVTRVEFRANQTLVCTDLSPTYMCNWKVPNVRNATYTLEAKAYDSSGNVGNSTVTVSAK